MKKLVNQIFIIPIIFFMFAILLFGSIYYFFMEDFSKKEFDKVNNAVIESEKRVLKAQMNSVIQAVDNIRTAGYNITEAFAKELLCIVSKNYIMYKKGKKKFFQNHNDKNMFFYIISKDLVYPKIAQTFVTIGSKKRLIVMYNDRLYIAVEKRYGQKIIGIAIKKDLVDNIVKKEIINYIDNISNQNPSYIAVGEVTNWFAEKGVFGKVVYHPFKKFIGKPLSMDKPDIKGNYYRKKYFNALKLKDNYFESYYFKNPVTGKYEKKLSYFVIYRPYNYIFVKGFYYSQIVKDMDKVKKEVFNDLKIILLVTIVLIGVLSFISFIIAYIISKRIIKKIFIHYDSLNNEFEKSKKLLHKRVYYDKVTGLPNINKLFEDLPKFKSLVIFDIEDFANINNLYGFTLGNDILICVSKFLKKRFKNVYRVGSDEFAVPMKVKVSQKVLKKISLFEVECNEILINFAIGASNVKDLYITAENAVKLAQKQKLKFLLYDTNLKEVQEKRFNQLQQIRNALNEDLIIPYYQCIVDRNGTVVKYEALMRLQIEGKTVSPFMFMDIIKESKLYHDFSRRMISKVFREIVTYNLSKVSINLSFIDIADNETRTLIINLLKTFFVGDRITFELLESESIENFEIVKNFIEEVKKYGATIAIDDFGSGYSNFINILSLKPDYVKIDGTLIKNLNSEEYYEIIKLIVNFSKKFGIETIAEFVENESIYDKLKTLDVDYYQGYYFCKPQPFDKIS